MKDIQTLKGEARDALEETREARQAMLAREARNKSLIQLSILIGAFCLILNVAFFFLSSMYFADKRANPLVPVVPVDSTNSARIAFAFFSGIVSAMSIAVAIAPKWVAHGVAALSGLVALIASVFALKKGMPFVLPAALFIMGALLPLLAWRSLLRSRAAWAFLIAMCAVLGLVLLFGAPKVKGQLDIGIWTALIMPGLLGVATVGLTMLRGDYRERI